MTKQQRAALILDSAAEYLRHRDPRNNNIYPHAIVIGGHLEDYEARLVLGRALTELANETLTQPNG